MGCFRTHWDVLGNSGIRWETMGCIGQSGFIGQKRGVLGNSGMYWARVGFIEQNRGILMGNNGKQWETIGNNGKQ